MKFILERKLKTGRNDSCVCGSGKKFKKCCGSPKNTTVRHSTKIEKTRLAGQVHSILIVPVYSDPKDSRNYADHNPTGKPGKYKVVFVLCRPNISMQSEDERSTAENLEGDSYLAIAPPAHIPPELPSANQIRIYARNDKYKTHVMMGGFPNKNGYLGKIVLEEIQAQNFQEAYHDAYALLAPTLSHWSAQFDIPIQVYQTDVIELRTNAIMMTMVNSSQGITLGLLGETEINFEFQAYTSIYREAMNSGSAHYQFLCLYKIIESIGWRRARVAKEMKDKGMIPTKYFEVVPADKQEQIKWLNQLYPLGVQNGWDEMTLSSILLDEVIGKKFNNISQNFLEKMRDDIAHDLTGQEGEIKMSIDNMSHINKVQKWLPIMRCIVRRMLKNDFPLSFLQFLTDS